MQRIKHSIFTMGVAGTLALTATVADAQQGRGRDGQGVPPGHRPPPGMCRVWVDGVPPGRQPAPTSCAEAARNRSANARVIYGERTSDSDVWRDGRRYEDDRTGQKSKAAKHAKKPKKAKNGRDDDRDRRADRNVCVDQNRDGVCDDRQQRRTGRSTDRRTDVCEDRDRDGRCDRGVGGALGEVILRRP